MQGFYLLKAVENRSERGIKDEVHILLGVLHFNGRVLGTLRMRSALRLGSAAFLEAEFA